MEPRSHCPVHDRGGAAPPGEGEEAPPGPLGARAGERKRKLQLEADELESMEGEQVSAAEGGKIQSMMDGEQLRLAKGGKCLQAL